MYYGDDLTFSDGVSLSVRRAWIEILLLRALPFFAVSLSVRRAWIEMFGLCGFILPFDVALRKESVDRNLDAFKGFEVQAWSLSVRRAWIEMPWGGWGARPPRGRSP